MQTPPNTERSGWARPETAPYLSVVIPTYNRRESLRRTLEGLARQAYPASRFEAVVVSDGSTDGTASMLAGLAPALPYRLRVVLQENGGPSRARNRGIREAKGDIVVLLDDDMEPVPEFLAEHASQHAADDRLVVIGPMLPDPARRAEEPLWIAWEHVMLGRQYDAWQTGRWRAAGPNHFYSGNASLRREHLLAVGGFDEAFKRQEDVELAYRMERQRGVSFRFHAAAAGLHRPDRSFESWARVPAAYGALDVERARRGDGEAWKMVRNGFVRRNAATRALTAFALAFPVLSAPTQRVLRLAAERVYGLRSDLGSNGGPAARVAFALLSALYNLRYVEGARGELDAHPETQGVPVWSQHTPFAARQQAAGDGGAPA